MFPQDKEPTAEENLRNASNEASYQRGRGDGMREMWRLMMNRNDDREGPIYREYPRTVR